MKCPSCCRVYDNLHIGQKWKYVGPCKELYEKIFIITWLPDIGYFAIDINKGNFWNHPTEKIEDVFGGATLFKDFVPV